MAGGDFTSQDSLSKAPGMYACLGTRVLAYKGAFVRKKKFLKLESIRSMLMPPERKLPTWIPPPFVSWTHLCL